MSLGLIDLELLPVVSGCNDGCDEFAKVTVRLFGKQSEADDTPVTLYIDSVNRDDGWDVALDLTPEQIRAVHSFLGFALDELRSRASSGGQR